MHDNRRQAWAGGSIAQLLKVSGDYGEELSGSAAGSQREVERL
jgi:hypothetical protein